MSILQMKKLRAMMLNNSQDHKAGGTKRSDSGRLAPKFTLDAICHSAYSWGKEGSCSDKAPLAVMNHEPEAHPMNLVA